MQRWLEGLNQRQADAVQTIQGPLLVLAGAGSGKTRVITHRIAYMIDNGLDAENILAVTFTNKAAQEMRERLMAMVGRVAGNVTMSTFHSLGLAMLREEAKRSKRSTKFVVYDAGDQMALLREIAASMKFDRSFDLGAVAARLSSWKTSFVRPGHEYTGDDPYKLAASSLYAPYEDALDSLQAVDFDDLIVKPTMMMEKSEKCRSRWSRKFKWVLVDEYQDTNDAQLRMLVALAGQHRNICVVGDDDQSIYGWRGAKVKNILNFEHDFPGCKKIHLEKNYRSTGRILALANYVIAENTQRYPKKMVAVRGRGKEIRIVVCEDPDSEAGWVAQQLKARLDSGASPSELAVLYRSNLLARTMETALRGQRLKYRVLGGRSFFDRKEVKDLIAYLRFCLNQSDSISLRRIINFPPRGVGTTTLKRLSSWSEAEAKPLWVAVKSARGILPRGDRAVEALDEFRNLMQDTKRSLRSGSRLVQSVKALIENIGLKQHILKGCATGKAFEKRWSLVEGFVEGLKSYQRNTQNPSLAEYIAQLTLQEMDRDIDEEGQRGRITLCTLHGAKGLEWNTVFVVGMEEGLLPHDRVLNPQVTDVEGTDLAEERRLFYVGITRAMDELVLTRALRRHMKGKLRARAPSRFVAEVPEKFLVEEDLTQPLSLDDAKARLAGIKAMLGD